MVPAVSDGDATVELQPTNKDKAAGLVGELFKLLPTAAGIMLALIWGLADRTTPAKDVLHLVRAGSIVLAVSILTSLLGLQFMVSRYQSDKSDLAGDSCIQGCFVCSWLMFVVGTALVIWSLFLL